MDVLLERCDYQVKPFLVGKEPVSLPVTHTHTFVGRQSLNVYASDIAKSGGLPEALSSWMKYPMANLIYLDLIQCAGRFVMQCVTAYSTY